MEPTEIMSESNILQWFLPTHPNYHLSKSESLPAISDTVPSSNIESSRNCFQWPIPDRILNEPPSHCLSCHRSVRIVVIVSCRQTHDWCVWDTRTALNLSASVWWEPVEKGTSDTVRWSGKWDDFHSWENPSCETLWSQGATMRYDDIISTS